MMKKISNFQKNIVNAACDIGVGDISEVQPEFLHSILCQVGLPRSAIKESRTFERINGSASLRIDAGSLWNGADWKDVALPYGVKPRLVLIYACAEAIRTKSPVIDLGGNAKEFLNRLNLDTTGRGYALFRTQMESLAACRMSLGYSTANKNITIDTKPVERYEAWYTNDGNQGSMWPGVMELSPKFFSTLTEHSVPLDPRAIAALKTSALSLDIYTFLANRLCRIRSPGHVRLYWHQLRSQFGQEYKDAKNFKNTFKQSLRRVLMVYPAAKVKEENGGIRLYVSPAPIKKTKVFNLKSQTTKEAQTELDF